MPQELGWFEVRIGLKGVQQDAFFYMLHVVDKAPVDGLIHVYCMAFLLSIVILELCKRNACCDRGPNGRGWMRGLGI